MANVINKTTFQQLPSVNTPDYPTVDWIINPTLPPLPEKYWKVSGETIVEMSQAEKDAVDVADLPAYKDDAELALDSRTDELIAQGFQCASSGALVFSLSNNARDYWNGLGNLAALGLLTEPDDFPIRVNTLDDSDAYDIPDIATAIEFFATAASTIRNQLEGGTALKDSIRSASDQAAVDAVNDARSDQSWWPL